MSYLKTSQKKHVETKTRTFSTPPKYLQTNHSSKGVRSTSYVHRTFVDAEPKVEPEDVRFKGMSKTQLVKLLKDLGEKKPTGNKSALQEQISDRLGKDFDETELPAFKKTRLKAIYKFVSGNNFDSGNLTDKQIVAELTNLISLEINGRPATKINNYTDQTPTVKPTVKKKPALPEPEEKTSDQKKGNNFKIDYLIKSRENDSGEQEYYIKWKGYRNDENTWASETDLKEDGHEQDIIDYLTKKKFLEFYNIAEKTKLQKIDDLSSKAKNDVKKMLKDLKSMLNKSGPVTISLLTKGRQQGKSADKNKDNFLTASELRKAIQNDGKLKQLFKIGRNGQVDENMDSLVGWKTWFQSMDKNKDKKYSIQEFAKSYLAAALKNTVRDKLIKGDYADETFERMVALFGIADKKPSKPVVTSSQIDNKKLPVVARSNTPPVVTPSPGKFQVGDRVKSTSKTGLTAGLIGIITKRTDKAASVTWDNQTETPSKPLKQLEPITIKPVTIKPVTIMDGFKETKEDIDKEKVPVVTPSKTAKKKSVQPLPGNFKVGDLVKNTSKTGLTAGLTGLITKRTPKTAAVFWEDGNDTTNKPLKELKMVTISKEAEEKIKTIFNSYDTKRTDNFLNNGEDFNFLQENLPRRSQVFLKKDLFEKPDGESGFSFDEFRFMLTVSPEMIAKFEEREAKSKSKGPAPAAAAPSPSPIAVKKIVKKEVKPQRTRQEDPVKAKKEKQARELAEQLAENTRNAALAREQDRQAAQKQEQDRQAAEKKITVVKNGDKYSVTKNDAFTKYKEKLNKIPPTTCKPTK